MPDYDLTKILKNSIHTDKHSHQTLPLKLRTFLHIPFRNVHNGLHVTVIMMNPSDADTFKSDQSVNKLIEFFAPPFKYQGHLIEMLTIVNIFPLCASNPAKAFDYLKMLQMNHQLESYQKQNLRELKKQINEADFIVCAWGKPTEGTVPYILFYKEVTSVIALLQRSQKDIHVFKVSDTCLLLTKSGDPRHPSGLRGKQLIDLILVNIDNLLGFY